MDQNQPNNNINKPLELTKNKPPSKLKNNYELVLNWYKINGKTLAGEEMLSNLHIRTLLKILGNPIWNQIYHCWAIEPKHVAELQNYVHHSIDLSKFVYFIEAYNNN